MRRMEKDEAVLFSWRNLLKNNGISHLEIHYEHLLGPATQNFMSAVVDFLGGNGKLATIGTPCDSCKRIVLPSTCEGRIRDWAVIKQTIPKNSFTYAACELLKDVDTYSALSDCK